MWERFGFLTKIISHLVGAAADIPVPVMLRGFIIGLFARLIKANVTEGEFLPEAYRSCGEYFARGLKLGARPLASTPVISPVDGTIRVISDITNPIRQIKGQDYTVQDLLGSDAIAFDPGSIAVLYLAPHNYHRVHAPFSAVIEEIKLIRGPLWPVNGWGLAHIKNLFCVNERVVMRGRCNGPDGAGAQFALVMVGATNVGRMELACVDLNAVSAAPHYRLSGEWRVTQGAELGRFRLGSTVILVTSFKLAALEQACAVRYGETIDLPLV